MEEPFIAVLNESELNEGTMKGVVADGTPVLLIKKDGKIYAYDDRCPHQQCQLSGGELLKSTVVCPCHEWAFKIETGEFTVEPAITLTVFECKVIDGKIYVKPEINPQ